MFNKLFTTLLVLFWLSWCFITIGPIIEQNYYMVRINQSVSNIKYDPTKRYFCWDWHSDKIRKKLAVDINVILKDQYHPSGMLFSTFNRISLVPWQLSNPVPNGINTQGLCIYIPPGFTPTIPFTLDQEIVYPGFLNLWNITTHLPTIVYDGKM